MLEGLYVGAAGMLAHQQTLDAIANNLANVNTNGYKAERVAFADLAYSQRGTNQAAQIGQQHGSGVRVASITRDFGIGPMEQTSNPLDLAIAGAGFFQVRNVDGQLALTRDGSFQLDQQGRLVTSTGEPLAPPIQVPPGTEPNRIAVAEDGTVRVDSQVVGRIRIYNVNAPGLMLSLGNNLFLPTPASGAPQAIAGRDSTIQQSTLERSNTDVAQAFTDMIRVQRAYDLSSRMIRTQDEMWSLANQIRRS